jgi:general secretion pathway protein D
MKVLFCFLLLFTSLAKAEQINLQKTTIADFAKIVSDYLAKPIIITSDVKQPISINGTFKTKEDLRDLFKNTVVSSGLYYDETSLNITVSNSSPKSDIVPIPIDNLIVNSYKLNQLSSSQVVKILSDSYKSKATFIDSVTSNSILVTGSEADHKNIQKIIADLDSPVRQVQIEAVISELSDTDYAGLDSKMENFARLNTTVDDFVKSSFVNPVISAASFGIKLLTSKSLRFFLDWIETSDNSVVLSKPKIVTLDRKEASIVVGQNVPFITGKSTSQASNTSTPFQTIERHDIGLKLQVTPIILPNGFVQLEIVQESSSVSADTSASDVITNKRAITSTALILDGGTLLLGGLSSNSDTTGHTSTVPQTGTFLDWFFSGNTKKHSNTNLVVLITAKILDSTLPTLPVSFDK